MQPQARIRRLDSFERYHLNIGISKLWVRAADVSGEVVCCEYARTGFGAFATGVRFPKG